MLKRLFKPSRLMFLLAILIGLLPMGYSLYSNFTFMAAPMEASVESMAPSSAPISDADMAEVEKQISEAGHEVTLQAPEGPPDAFNEIVGSAAEAGSSVSDIVEEWMGVIGTVNGILFGWAGFFFQRKEGSAASENTPSKKTDLDHLRFKDRLLMWIKSFRNPLIRAQYRLRKNKKWSVYGSNYNMTSLDEFERHLTVIDRTNGPWEDLLPYIGNTSLGDVVQLPMHQFFADTETAHVEIAAWVVSPENELIIGTMRGALDFEAFIMFVLTNDDGEEIKYTLRTHMGIIPNDLASWEHYIEAFRKRFLFRFEKSELKHVFAITRETTYEHGAAR